MFTLIGLRGRLNYLEDTVRCLRAELKRLGAELELLNKRPTVELVTCEQCGCAVIEKEALKGKSVIKGLCIVHCIPGLYEERSEHIHTPHYCKACSLRKT